jgi:hypothetical protein
MHILTVIRILSYPSSDFKGEASGLHQRIDTTPCLGYLIIVGGHQCANPDFSGADVFGRHDVD